MAIINSKTWWSLWQYYRDEPAETVSGTIDNFPCNNALFAFKENRWNTC